jgi:hypothetical protein
MVTPPNKRTLTATAAILIAALLACKKSEEETPPVPSASAEPLAASPDAAAAEPEPEEDAPELGDVTRYKDKEKEVEGVVVVLEKDVKVFNETDEDSDHVATLNKGIFVNRLASVDEDWLLVEFPSGVGELSPGWVEAKFLSDKNESVSADKVKAQQAAVVVKKTVKEDDKEAEGDAKDDNKLATPKEDPKKEKK